jgi:hypothetical protein
LTEFLIVLGFFFVPLLAVVLVQMASNGLKKGKRTHD